MERRTFLSSIALTATASLAGCADSVGGTTFEIVENDYETVETRDHEIENREVLGTEARTVTLILSNTGDETVAPYVQMELYDDDDVLLDETDQSIGRGEEIDPESEIEFTQDFEGEADDVALVNLYITDEFDYTQ